MLAGRLEDHFSTVLAADLAVTVVDELGSASPPALVHCSRLDDDRASATATFFTLTNSMIPSRTPSRP
jgi:hypothetical protein